MIKDYGSQNQLLNEVKRLTRVSERQSAMLAQALKEKNDRAPATTYNSAEFWKNRFEGMVNNRNEYAAELREVRISLEAARKQLRELEDCRNYASERVSLFSNIEALQERLRIQTLDFEAANARLRDIQNSAKVFFRAVGQ